MMFLVIKDFFHFVKDGIFKSVKWFLSSQLPTLVMIVFSFKFSHTICWIVLQLYRSPLLIFLIYSFCVISPCFKSFSQDYGNVLIFKRHYDIFCILDIEWWFCNHIYRPFSCLGFESYCHEKYPKKTVLSYFSFKFPVNSIGYSS